jgi:hypothetical protein
MKKIITIIVLSIFTFSISSCNSDDDNGDTGNALVGTAWFGTDDDEGEVYTFTSTTIYTFSGDGPTQQSTYTFDGSEGILSASDGDFNFSIVGDIMTVNDGSSSQYIKQ